MSPSPEVVAVSGRDLTRKLPSGGQSVRFVERLDHDRFSNRQREAQLHAFRRNRQAIEEGPTVEIPSKTLGFEVGIGSSSMRTDSTPESGGKKTITF